MHAVLLIASHSCNHNVIAALVDVAAATMTVFRTSKRKPQVPMLQKLKSRYPALGDAAGKSDCSAASGTDEAFRRGGGAYRVVGF